MGIEMGEMGVLILNGRVLCAGDIIHVHLENRWLPVLVKWCEELGWYGRSVSDEPKASQIPLQAKTVARWPNRYFIAV